MSERERPRVGVLVETAEVPRWQQTLISGLEELPCEPVVISGGPVAAFPGRATPLFARYERADRERFASGDDALAVVACRPAPVEMPVGPGGIEGLRELDLDLLVWLRHGRPPAAAAGCARHGAWFAVVGGAVTPAQAPLFRELCRGGGVAIAAVHATDAHGAERVLRTSHVQGGEPPVSLHRARCQAFARVARLALRTVASAGVTGDGDAALGGDPRPAVGPLTRRETAAGLTRLGLRIGRRKLEARLFEEQWYVAYRHDQPPPPGLAGEREFKALCSPPGRYYADPFPLRHDGRRTIVFEDFVRETARAILSYVEVDDGGLASEPRTALETPTHLSYPFLLAEGDSLFLIPETRQARRVELWRAARFPSEWTFEGALLDDVDAADATLLRHGDMLWMFVAVAVDGGAPHDELFLFSSESVRGEWRSHPANPVVSDVRSARPAGRVFSHGGRLIRPAQDCSREYGWRVVLNEIRVLDESRYVEAPIGRIEPASRGTRRIHTYNAEAGIEAVDGLRLRPRLPLRRRPPRVERFRFRLED